MTNNRKNILRIAGLLVLAFVWLGHAPQAVAGIEVDNAIMLDPFDPVPEIQFRHYGGYAWGYGCSYNPCGHRPHYNRCYRDCYGYSRCRRDCGDRHDGCRDNCGRHDGCRGDDCYGRDDDCRGDGCYRHGDYDGCRGDGCRGGRHDDCRGDGCRDHGRDGCHGDDCRQDDCRGDDCRRHDGCDGDGCGRLKRHDEQADRYDDQSDWYERRYMHRHHRDDRRYD
jgi:hypothetical protein